MINFLKMSHAACHKATLIKCTDYTSKHSCEHQVTWSDSKVSSLWQNKLEVYSELLTACYHFAKKIEPLESFFGEAEYGQESLSRCFPNPKLNSDTGLPFLVVPWLQKINLWEGKGKRFRFGMKSSINYWGGMESIKSLYRELLDT
jgi:hypothetical protein